MSELGIAAGLAILAVLCLGLSVGIMWLLMDPVDDAVMAVGTPSIARRREGSSST